MGTADSTLKAVAGEELAEVQARLRNYQFQRNSGSPTLSGKGGFGPPGNECPRWAAEVIADLLDIAESMSGRVAKLAAALEEQATHRSAEVLAELITAEIDAEFWEYVARAIAHDEGLDDVDFERAVSCCKQSFKRENRAARDHKEAPDGQH